MSKHGNIEPVNNPFNEMERDSYIQRVWQGVITISALSFDYHIKIAEKLTEGIRKGFGNVELFRPFQSETVTFKALANDAYRFSAAKQFQQVRIMSGIINRAPESFLFNDFRKVAEVVFEDFNKTYLEAEFNTAITQAQNARDWLQIERDKDIFPLLKYKTQQDGRVRPTHQALEGIVKPVDDPFWDTFTPANGWNCRCFTQRLETGEVTDTSEIVVPEQDVPSIFRFNAGKQKQVFSEKHGYYRVGRNQKVLKDQNFGMPIPFQEQLEGI